MVTNLKLADAEVPFSDYGRIKTVEVINPDRDTTEYLWNIEVQMRIEGGTSDQSFKVQFTVGPEMREEIIRQFQNPILKADPPTAEQRARIEAAYLALHPENR